MLALTLVLTASHAASAAQQHWFHTIVLCQHGLHLAFTYPVERKVSECRVFAPVVMTLKEHLQRRAAGQSVPALDFRTLALRLLQVSLMLDVRPDPTELSCCQHVAIISAVIAIIIAIAIIAPDAAIAMFPSLYPLPSSPSSQLPSLSLLSSCDCHHDHAIMLKGCDADNMSSG